MQQISDLRVSLWDKILVTILLRPSHNHSRLIVYIIHILNAKLMLRLLDICGLKRLDYIYLIASLLREKRAVNAYRCVNSYYERSEHVGKDNIVTALWSSLILQDFLKFKGYYSGALLARLRYLEAAKYFLGEGVPGFLRVSQQKRRLFLEAINHEIDLYVKLESNTSSMIREKQAYANPVDYASAIRDIYKIEYSSALHSRVNGRSVAIVGPSTQIEQSGDEIDQFDVVVRIGTDRPTSRGAQREGNRTDICYLNGVRAKSYLANGYEFTGKDVVYVVKAECIRSRLRKIGLKAENIYFPNPPFRSEYSLMSLTLIDLLRYKPKAIKLFGFDLNTNRSYPKGYLDNHYGLQNCKQLNDQLRLNKIFSVHDPCLPFLQLKEMIAATTVEVDGVLKRVLSLSLKDYLASMEDCC